MSSKDAWWAGYHQSERAEDLANYQSSKGFTSQTSDAASDMEPSWESPSITKQLVSGDEAHGWALYYDFGSADGCPQSGNADGACNNGWHVSDVGYVSFAALALPLPEIYYTANASQWTVVREWWDRARAGHLFLLRGHGVDGSGADAGLLLGHAQLPQQRPRRVGARVFRLLSLRVVAATLVGLAAGAGGGFALAGSISGPAEKTAALSRLASVATTDSNATPAPAPTSAPRPIPGQMLATDVPVPIAPSVVRVKNGWLVSDGKTLVAVYAGAAGNDASVGRVVVVRQNLVAGRQTVRAIDAGSTGGLVIAAAPLGTAVESSAQRGRLRLRTAGGRFLTLDLGTNTISRDAHGAPLP